MSAYETGHPTNEDISDELLRAWLYYYEPLETEVDLNNKKAQALVIHDSAPSVQAKVDGLIAENIAGNFDRLAMPDPAEKFVKSELPLEWATLLESKHRFDEVHIFETDGQHRAAARTAIKNTFPDLKIAIHKTEVDPERSSSILALQCADPRFQEQYRLMMEDRAPGNVYERYALPGAELAIQASPEVRRWINSSVSGNRIQTIYMLGHIDCAIAGGLSSHYNHEVSEAEYHARAFDGATKTVKSMAPGRIDVIPHMVGSEGKIGVRDIQQTLGLGEQ